MNCHVGNEIGDLTHLFALHSRIRLIAVLEFDLTCLSVVYAAIDGTHTIIGPILTPSVEPLQSFKRGGTFDLALIVRDHQDRISIKVRSRETLCHGVMDSNRILSCSTQKLLGCRDTIVYGQLRNLESAAMREPNESNAIS